MIVRLSGKCRFRSERFVTGSCGSAPPTSAMTGVRLDSGSVQSERGSARFGTELHSSRKFAIKAVV